ncbi:MAG TPA: hypothetical protein VHZ07_24785 [Bryobacteraceae bacterium]|jgi:hypothetical protein|nr:hypothetical protein [Bryobacteraceae bacterium]
MQSMRFPVSTLALFLLGVSASALDLRNAHINVEGSLTGPEHKALELLISEVEARTGLNWPIGADTPFQHPVITLHHAQGASAAEGFRLVVRNGRVDIQGSDERGTLFGVGRFLRTLNWKRGDVDVADNLDITTAPKYLLRGHQIGYRPKVNTYDAWTPAIFEQYVRDLAVFGTNAIELIPPRSDDVEDSPHFPLPKLEMMVQMSRIIAEYGLQVWIWYPALDKDYTDPRTVQFALKEWGQVFRALPHIDAVFVPGGDPGNTPPRVLMDLLEKESRVLRQFHPKAQMWVSPQGFSQAGLAHFIAILNQHPKWLNGVVYGPGVRVTIKELRSMVPEEYPLRSYPDITHSIHCQYPVPQWDTAFAVTEAREIINPRPFDESTIFRLTSPSSLGFITYSEGVNDDVNKVIWSSLGWDPNADPVQILREFARYFINPEYEDSLAQAVVALEKNWRGPLLTNRAVDNTLLQVQALEQAANPQMLLNWRFQQILYRAYYDEYVRQRLVNETSLEQQALARLRGANEANVQATIERAKLILDRSATDPVALDLRSRIFALAEALYQSIRMQLSVDRYKAVAVSRGANLDTLDFPLNNRVWIEKQLAQLQPTNDAGEIVSGIRRILNRADPGPGGFYDDLGNPTMQPHLVDEGPGYSKDPAGRFSVQFSAQTFSGGFVGRASRDAIRPDGPASFMQMPTAWWNYAQSRYDTPIMLRYDHLDSHARYQVRVVYVGDAHSAKVRLAANDGIDVHPYLQVPVPLAPLTFDVPVEATRNGTLTLRWSPEFLGGAPTLGIAEVYLIRK